MSQADKELFSDHHYTGGVYHRFRKEEENKCGPLTEFNLASLIEQYKDEVIWASAQKNKKISEKEAVKTITSEYEKAARVVCKKGLSRILFGGAAFVLTFEFCINSYAMNTHGAVSFLTPREIEIVTSFGVPSQYAGVAVLSTTALFMLFGLAGMVYPLPLLSQRKFGFLGPNPNARGSVLIAGRFEENLIANVIGPDRHETWQKAEKIVKARRSLTP